MSSTNDRSRSTADIGEPDHDHEARIAQVRASLPSSDELRDLADLFRALGDPTRVRILQALAGGEACVYDLARGLEMTPSAISHQLRVLRNLRLVRNEKRGREVYYDLDDHHVVQLIAGSLSHLRHEDQP